MWIDGRCRPDLVLLGWDYWCDLLLLLRGTSCSHLIFLAIIGRLIDLPLETKVIIITIPNLLVDALRNPIIARFAFRVNKIIQKETVEDRRQAVILAARKRREQRRTTRLKNIILEELTWHNLKIYLKWIQYFNPIWSNILIQSCLKINYEIN